MLLDRKPTPINMAGLAVLETYHWQNTADDGSRNVGSEMTALQRFAVLRNAQQAIKDGKDPVPLGVLVQASARIALSGLRSGFDVLAQPHLLSDQDRKAYVDSERAFQQLAPKHMGADGKINMATFVPAYAQVLDAL